MLRIFFVTLLLGGTLFAKTYKVVYDLTTGSEAVLAKKLVANTQKLKAYYETKGDQLKVAVVVSGKAYRFFIQNLAHSPYANESALLKSQPARTKMLEAFSKIATIEMCGMGMKHRNISPETLYPFVKPAFNKTDALVRYQNAGYAYIPLR